MDNDFNERTYCGLSQQHDVDKPRINFILRNIPDDSLKILDIGCFDGAYAVRYKKNSNAVYGVEGSRTAAANARSKGIIVEHGDFMAKDFYENIKFDIVVAGEVIEHVFDTDLFLERIRKMLKPTGKLIITTPNVASLPRRILLLLGINPLLENRATAGNAGHIRYFTFSDLERLLLDNGFKIIRSQSDSINFNNKGTLYSTLLPKIFKRIGKTIMVYAQKV